MTTDTGQTRAFSGSARNLILLVAAGIVMTGLSAALFIFSLNSARDLAAMLVIALGAFGTVFFGAALLVALKRLLTHGQTVVTLAPEGIRDIRIAPEIIPWRAIEEISTWGAPPNAFIVLGVRPEAEKELSLGAIPRWTRGMNARLGADGLCLGLSDLAVEHEAFLDTVLAYWDAHR